MPDNLQTIEQQIADLQKKKREILDNQRSAVLKETRSNVRVYGFTVAELGLGSAAASAASGGNKPKLPAKYANPANPAITWHGSKGPKPKWVVEFLAAGGNLEDLLIQKS